MSATEIRRILQARMVLPANEGPHLPHQPRREPGPPRGPPRRRDAGAPAGAHGAVRRARGRRERGGRGGGGRRGFFFFYIIML